MDFTFFSIQATNFEAIDRHLLGLKLTALENGIPLPELFRDKAYGYAMHFRLSTSQVMLMFNSYVKNKRSFTINPRILWIR